MGDADQDNGILTSLDQLPVIELAYGGGRGRYDLISFQLGPFVCEGKDPTELYPSEKAETDYYFKYYASYVN